MPTGIFTNAHTGTPTLRVSEARGLVVRDVLFHRREVGDPIDTRVTEQRFDAVGRLVASRDPYLFDLAKTDETTPFNLRQTMSLSGVALATDSVDAGWRVGLQGEAGQSLERWDGRGSHSLTQYDELLRPTAIRERGQDVAEHMPERFTYADASAEAAAHNLCGLLIRHDDPAGTVHVHDQSLAGGVLSHTRHFLRNTEAPDWPLEVAEREALLESGDGATTLNAYSANSEPWSQTDALGNRQAFTYTIDGQLKNTRLTLAGDSQTEKLLVSDLRYNATGQLETETAGNGVITRRHYDEANGRLTQLSAHKADGSPLQDLNYLYDPVGNVLSIEDAAQPIRYFNNQRIEPIKTYRYDTLYQLIYATGCEAQSGRGGPALPDFQSLPLDPNQIANYTQTYHYDAGGNLLDLMHVGPQAHSRTLTRSRYSNRCLPERDNRPPTEAELAAGFDTNGNLCELQPGQRLSWDLRNQLRKVCPVVREDKQDDCECYIYDGGGQRVRKVHSAQTNARTIIREVRYLPGLEIRSHSVTGEILHVITASAGSNTVQLLHWVARQPEEMPRDQVRYSLNDHLKSCALELDQNAKLICQEWNYPFGGTAYWAGRNATEAMYKTVRYSGKERDATGLYYYGFRYYASWLQRWINPDPAGSIDGINRYSMVGNSPATLVDHMGLMRRSSLLNSPQSQATTNKSSSKNTEPGLTHPKEHENRIYNFVDPRSEEGGVRRKIVSSFSFPTPTSSDSIRYYLDQSKPGNSFAGIMHIKTGELHIYPLDAKRQDADEYIWAKKYSGTTKDNGRPILHATVTNSALPTSHEQLVNKISGERDHYVGFSINDLRHIRGYEHGGFLAIADYRTSVLYGRSRTLNTLHFKAISDEGVSYSTDKETYEKNKGEFIFELPIELKLKIINTIITDLGENHDVSALLRNELSRSELNPNYKPIKKFYI
jgi:insecticidal toxin complex protein TccC